jgi:hypothetical protein
MEARAARKAAKLTPSPQLFKLQRSSITVVSERGTTVSFRKGILEPTGYPHALEVSSATRGLNVEVESWRGSGLAVTVKPGKATILTLTS